MSSQMLHDKHKFWGLAATNMPSLACLVASHVWHHRPGLCKEDVRHQRHHVVRVLLSGRQHFDARPVSDDAEVGRKQLQLVEDARARARVAMNPVWLEQKSHFVGLDLPVRSHLILVSPPI